MVRQQSGEEYLQRDFKHPRSAYEKPRQNQTDGESVVKTTARIPSKFQRLSFIAPKCNEVFGMAFNDKDSSKNVGRFFQFPRKCSASSIYFHI